MKTKQQRKKEARIMKSDTISYKIKLDTISYILISLIVLMIIFNFILKTAELSSENIELKKEIESNKLNVVNLGNCYNYFFNNGEGITLKRKQNG